jgi:hypothetical protein
VPRDKEGVGEGVGEGVALGVADLVGVPVPDTVGEAVPLAVPLGLAPTGSVDVGVREVVREGVPVLLGVPVAEGVRVELRVAREVGKAGCDTLPTGLPVNARVAAGDAVGAVDAEIEAVAGRVKEGAGLVVAEGDSVRAGDRVVRRVKVAVRVRVGEEGADSVSLDVSVGALLLAVGGPLGDRVGATVREPPLEALDSPVTDNSAEALTGLLGVA